MGGIALIFAPPPKGTKIDQNLTQNGSKFKTMFKSEKVVLQEPLGSTLGRLGGYLGVQNCAPVLASVVFGEKSRF